MRKRLVILLLALPMIMPFAAQSEIRVQSNRLSDDILLSEFRQKMENERFWASIAKASKERTDKQQLASQSVNGTDDVDDTKTETKKQRLSISRPWGWVAEGGQPAIYRNNVYELLPDAYGEYECLAKYAKSGQDSVLTVSVLHGWGKLYKKLLSKSNEFIRAQKDFALFELKKKDNYLTLSGQKENIKGLESVRFDGLKREVDGTYTYQYIWHIPLQDDLYMIVLDSDSSLVVYDVGIKKFFNDLEIITR